MSSARRTTTSLGPIEDLAIAARAFLLEFTVGRLQRIEVKIVERDEPSAHEIVAQVGKQHPEGREMTGRARIMTLRMTDFPRHGRGMQRPCATICNQNEVCRRQVRARS